LVTIKIKLNYYRQTRAASAAFASPASQTATNDADRLPHDFVNRDISTGRPRFPYSGRNAPIIGRGFRKLQTFFS
jgi:hypothetical protein